MMWQITSIQEMRFQCGRGYQGGRVRRIIHGERWRFLKEFSGGSKVSRQLIGWLEIGVPLRWLDVIPHPQFNRLPRAFHIRIGLCQPLHYIIWRRGLDVYTVWSLTGFVHVAIEPAGPGTHWH